MKNWFCINNLVFPYIFLFFCFFPMFWNLLEYFYLLFLLSINQIPFFTKNHIQIEDWNIYTTYSYRWLQVQKTHMTYHSKTNNYIYRSTKILKNSIFYNLFSRHMCCYKSKLIKWLYYKKILMFLKIAI